VQVPTFAPGAELPGAEHLLGISEVGEMHDAHTALAGLAAEGRRNSRGAAWRGGNGGWKSHGKNRGIWPCEIHT